VTNYSCTARTEASRTEGDSTNTDTWLPSASHIYS